MKESILNTIITIIFSNLCSSYEIQNVLYLTQNSNLSVKVYIYGDWFIFCKIVIFI